MTSSGGGSLETSADSNYPNFSFSTTSNQFMTTSFSDLLTSGNDIYSGNYQNRDRINVSRGFSDRLADRIGRSGVPKFKSITPPSLPISPPSVSPSSYFSIPPGLSPAELLDSPVLLSASNILPSPTTGTLSAHQSYNWRGNSGNFQQNIKQEDRNYSDFSFQPQPIPVSSFLPSSTTISTEQPWNNSQEPTTRETDFSTGGNTNVKSEFPRLLQSFSPEISTIQQANNNNNTQISNGGNNQQSDYNPYNSQSSQTLREKRRSEDGYNWRKYGQKQVKGSENPRSYYKCTYPNCPTKKKVERSLDGQITEIVYKGTHNHPKPQSTRRSAASSHQIQAASSAVAVPTSSDVSDHHLMITHGTTTNQMELVTTPENSSISIGDEEFDQSSQRSKSGGDEFDEDETDAKRWKRESENEGISAVGSRTVREPRVVVQTTSDIDILDDGYRWRKYGQKVVKGNPNPRSYYKCTSSGCPVRKHVERASHDLRAVITTYEGKHNHDVPAARGSGSSNRPPPATTHDNNNNNNNNHHHHATMHSTLVRPYSSSVRIPVSEGQTPFTLQMLQSPGSFGFSGFSNPLGSSFMNQYQQQQSESVYSMTKEEPREDMLLESLLY